MVDTVDVIIWRTDSVDSFAPNFTTSVSFNGGTPIVINTGLLTNGTTHPPIVATIPVPFSLSTQTMDFIFSDNLDNFAGDSVIRVAGIQAIFTEVPVPEPSTFALLGLGLVGVVRRARRRQR